MAEIKDENTIPEAYTEATKGVGGTVSLVDENGNKTSGVVAGAPEQSYWDNISNLYQKMYQSRQDANNQALADAQAQADASAQRQMEALSNQYQGLNKELYRNYMANQRVMPQQLAAQGYTGGATESTMNKLMTAYQEGLNSNEQARLANEASINAAIDQQKYEAQAAANTANANALNEWYQAQAQVEAGKRSDDETRAQTLGATGDFSGYLNLGYSQNEVDYMTRLWLAQNPGLKAAWVAAHPEDAARLGITITTGGGGGGKNPIKPTDTEKEKGKDKQQDKGAEARETNALKDEVKGYLTQGYTTQQVAQALSQAVTAGNITQAQASAALSAALQGSKA